MEAVSRECFLALEINKYSKSAAVPQHYYFKWGLGSEDASSILGFQPVGESLDQSAVLAGMLQGT